MHYLVIALLILFLLLIAPIIIIYSIVYAIFNSTDKSQKKDFTIAQIPHTAQNTKKTILHESTIPKIEKPYPPSISEKENNSWGKHTEALNNPKPSPQKKQSFIKRKLLTKSEHKFLLHIMQARPDGIAIACKVGLWGIVHNIHQQGWNVINQKHIDFVLYNLQENNILLVIELDDPSHLKEKIQQRDRIKDDILYDAGIPILRIPTSKEYDISDLREKILAKISPDQLNKK
jgi:very-short-patch-repair endonuclease